MQHSCNQDNVIQHNKQRIEVKGTIRIFLKDSNIIPKYSILGEYLKLKKIVHIHMSVNTNKKYIIYD